jgi:hypothetical protein
MADNQVTVEQLLRRWGRRLSRCPIRWTSGVENGSRREELAGRASSPAPGEEFFQAQFSRVETAVAGLAPGDGGFLAGRLDALAEKQDAVARGWRREARIPTLPDCRQWNPWATGSRGSSPVWEPT